MQGRTTRRLYPIKVKPGTPLRDLLGMFKQAPVAAQPLSAPSQTISGQSQEWGHLTELYTNILMDDCESSALLAKLAKKTVLSMMEQMGRGGVQAALGAGMNPFGGYLKKACEGWPIFNQYTDKSWSLMADIVERGGRMLAAKHLQIMSSIGLASTASAGEGGAVDASDLNGHCFNIGLLQTPSMDKPEVMILEGTAETIFMDTTNESPQMQVKLMTECTDPSNSNYIERSFQFPTFLTLFGGTVEHMLRIMDTPNGGMYDMQSGWPHAQPVTGWVGKTMVMNGLKSERAYPLQFYNRVIYTGWACTSLGRGCMPVQEAVQGGIVTGCHPYDLHNLSLRGVSADVTPEELSTIAEVVEETTPPMVDTATFKTLSSYWVPGQPLESINVRSQAERKEGVEYVRIAVMETPGVPEFIPLMLEAKGQAVTRANEINGKRADSDGIVGRVSAGGTCVKVLIDVPVQNSVLTYIDSLKQALHELDWPTRVSAVPGGIHH